MSGDIEKAKTESLPELDSPAMCLGERLRKNGSEAKAAIADIARFVRRESPEIAQTVQASKKGFRLVVDASDEVLEKIDEGSIKLTTDRLGNTYAQIKNAKGRYGKKLPIKREDFRQGIDPVQAANSLQLKAMQGQLDAMADQIEAIDERARDILAGQHDDRMGLLQSGMDLYLEANSASDPAFRAMLSAQAIRSFSDAGAQLALEMSSDIEYLANREYDSAKGKRAKLIEDKMRSINECFPAVHRAFMAKAAIYCERGELASMAAALGSYARVLDGTVVKHAGLLAECDASDDGSDQGVWRSRAALRLDVGDIAKRLEAPEKTFYLEPCDDEGDGE